MSAPPESWITIWRGQADNFEFLSSVWTEEDDPENERSIALHKIAEQIRRSADELELYHEDPR